MKIQSPTPASSKRSCVREVQCAIVGNKFLATKIKPLANHRTWLCPVNRKKEFSLYLILCLTCRLLPGIGSVEAVKVRAAFTDTFLSCTSVNGFHHAGIGMPHQVSDLGGGETRLF